MGATTAPLPDIQSTEAAEAGVRAFLQLAALWNLTREEMVILLGMRSTSTLDNWRKKPPETLSRDTMERISYLLHIHRSLRQIFPADRAPGWLRRPNSAPPFLGRSGMDFMLEGRVQNLLDVHRYLKGAGSGAF
jgi:hypothetical protein